MAEPIRLNPLAGRRNSMEMSSHGTHTPNLMNRTGQSFNRAQNTDIKPRALFS